MATVWYVDDPAENEKIARSFIISNIPELKVKYDDECAEEDFKAVTDICNFLQVPGPVDKSKVERIGIRLLDDVFRDLRIELQDAQHVTMLLQRADWLKTVPVLKNLVIFRAERFPPIKNYRWIPGIGFTIDQTIPAARRFRSRYF
uniref:Uncharacterized protein n=1 Tax=Panagrolaimus sp. JU765 TaxID=591449 RepID=A0AC34QVD1_9BILA